MSFNLSLIVVLLAILLQLATAIYALIMVRLSGRKIGWMMISTAFLLMSFRRVITLVLMIQTPDYQAVLSNEILGLVISLLVFLGTMFIKKHFEYMIQTQQKLRDSEESLLQINASKDRLFSLIAHDLKNPFGTLLNFSSLLRHDYENLPPAKIQDFIIRINNSAQRTHALLQNLLQWSRSQIGTLDIFPEEIDIFRLIQENFLLMNENARTKNITLLNEVEAGIQAYADENMISTVIRNLLSNAIKFTPANGTIRLAAKKENREIVISVADSGIGIAPGNISKLFDITTNFTTYGTDNEKGTGLGLIICREFIEKNKGRIWVESELNMGTTFFFAIPAVNHSGSQPG